jgi:DNA-binding MarR family transcriptional regulator
MSQQSLRSLFLAFEHANAHWRRTMSLGVNEFLVLFHLWMRERPMTMGDVARLVNVTTGGLTSWVERLERNDLVRREPDPTDRRRTNLVLTNTGGRAREDFLACIVSAEQELEQAPHERREAVHSFLHSVTRTLEELPQEQLR